jgi:hypothetical protein
VHQAQQAGYLQVQTLDRLGEWEPQASRTAGRHLVWVRLAVLTPVPQKRAAALTQAAVQEALAQARRPRDA